MNEPRDWTAYMTLFGCHIDGPDRLNKIAGLVELRRGQLDWYGWWDLTGLDLDNQLVDEADGRGWHRVPDFWALRGITEARLREVPLEDAQPTPSPGSPGGEADFEVLAREASSRASERTRPVNPPGTVRGWL